MGKKIIAVVVIALVLGAGFFASYTFSLKYWDKLEPYIRTEVTATPTEAVPFVTTTKTADATTEAAVATSSFTESETAANAALPSLTVEKTVEMPTDETWKLVLLNRHNQITESYVPTLAPVIEGSTVQVDARMTDAFQQMYNAAQADGITLTPVEGYISRELQNSLYEKKVEELLAQDMTPDNAAQTAAESILPAGCSEDNIGISVCIGLKLESFAQTDTYEWLQTNAWKYGFIERYTADKESVTEVNARPWYWRYVGTDAAELMHETGQCLEEFLQG